MAKSKASAVVSSATAVFAAALPLEAEAQTSNLTLYGRVDITRQSVGLGNNVGLGTNESASSPTAVVRGDSRFHGTGFNGGLTASRLGVRGSEDLAGGLSAIYAYEYGLTAGGGYANSTSSNVVSAGGDRTRYVYLTRSPFGTNPASLGLGATGLDAKLSTDLDWRAASAFFRSPSFTVSDPGNLYGRWGASVKYNQLEIDYDGTATSPTFGNSILSTRTVALKDRYVGAGAGLEVGWRSDRRRTDALPVGLNIFEVKAGLEAAWLWRNSKRQANEINVCTVSVCGADENFATGFDSDTSGWTYSAGAALDLRWGYKAFPATILWGGVGGGWNYLSKISRFNAPITVNQSPANFGLNSSSQLWAGLNLGMEFRY